MMTAKTNRKLSASNDSRTNFLLNSDGGSKTFIVMHKSDSAEIKLPPEKNLVIHSLQHKDENGLMESGFCFDDEMSTGKFNEIHTGGVRIFFNDISTNKTRIINAEFTSPFVEMLFLLEGQGGESYGKHLCRITGNQHNLFFREFFKGNYHLESNKFQIFGIQLSEKFFKRLIDEDAKSLYNILEGIERKKEHVQLAKQNLPISPAMKAIVYDIMKSNKTGYMKRLFLESKIIELFMLQIEQAESTNNGTVTKFKKEDIDKIHDAKSFIEKNMLEKFTLLDVSRKSGLNDFKLKKGFKELFGTTVFNYLNELKMDYAKRLILDEKKTVGDTAFILGYSEPHHFSAAFKRKFGYPPRELK